MKKSIDELISLKKILVLDGALATELERAGKDINDSLWSTKILIEDSEAIKKVHLSYLEAGCDIILTSSYQTTIKGLMKRGYIKDEAIEIIKKSFRIANEAKEEYLLKNSVEVEPIIGASIGPYGAFLSDGSEYTGNYEVLDSEMRDFHYEKIKILKDEGVELFACETIPSFREALVIQKICEELEVEYYISFSAKDEYSISDGTSIRECAGNLNGKYLKGIGINCTAPEFLESLIREIKSVYNGNIVVYPNSGEIFDPVSKTWSGNGQCVFDLAENWIRAGANIIGGCCKTTPQDIKKLADSIKNKKIKNLLTSIAL